MVRSKRALARLTVHAVLVGVLGNEVELLDSVRSEVLHLLNQRRPWLGAELAPKSRDGTEPARGGTSHQSNTTRVLTLGH